MSSRILTISIFLVLGLAASVAAYGPSIHMRQADHYIAFCELLPAPYPGHNPDLLRRERAQLLLGAIWPDLANVIVPAAVPGKGGPSHAPEFNYFLLQDALSTYPGDDWKVPFAVGNLMHCTGDIGAQVMLTQHLAVRAQKGGR